MNSFLDKNISYINKYNSSLADKLKESDTFSKIYEINQNLMGEYNLVVNGNPIHSITGAQQEAEKLFASVSYNTKNSIHVIYGLGLGYVPDVFSQKSKGSVIIFEPDLETLRLVFEAVDLKDSLSRKNVFVVSDLDEFENIFETVFRYKTKVSLSVLDYYKIVCANEIELFRAMLDKLFSIYSFNFKYQAKELHNFMEKTLLCLDKKYNKPLLADNKDKLKNIPALIVSAGPSLTENIETIKKYQDKAMIFCVGTALKTLYKNGIVPDFLNVIEKYNTSLHFNVPCTKDMILISEPFTSSAVYDFDFKDHYLSVSLEVDSNRWFLEKAEKELIPFETKGTVSYQALYSALYLGCNPIILVGQDLAYVKGHCYAKGSEFEGLECLKDEETGNYKIAPKNFEEYKNKYFKANVEWSDETKAAHLKSKLASLNRSLVFVDSQDGGKLPTESGYALFLEYIKDFAKQHSGKVKLINSSIGGALIEGFDTIPLDKVLCGTEYSDINKELLKNNFQNKSSFNYQIIIKNLESDLTAIKEVRTSFEKGCQMVKNLGYAFKRTSSLSQDVLTKLKKAADLYVLITDNHTNKNRLLKTLIMKENSELAFYMKETDGSVSEEIIKTFYTLFNNYFNNGLSKIEKTSTSIENTIKILNEENKKHESCDSKS